MVDLQRPNVKHVVKIWIAGLNFKTVRSPPAQQAALMVQNFKSNPCLLHPYMFFFPLTLYGNKPGPGHQLGTFPLKSAFFLFCFSNTDTRFKQQLFFLFSHNNIHIAQTTVIIHLMLLLLCRLLLVRLVDCTVNLSVFYSYRLIGKLTAFFQLQEFSQRNQTWELRTSTFAARLFLLYSNLGLEIS